MPLDLSYSTCCTINVSFPLHGSRLPIHYHAALYAALRELPDIGAWIGHAEDVAIAPIRGRTGADGLLALTADSRLLLRLPADALPRVLGLAGHTLVVDGHGLDVAQPQIDLPRAMPGLHADLVVFDHGEATDALPTDAGDAQTALKEMRHQLDLLEIDAEPILGEAGVLQLRGRALAGFGLRITGLAPDDSIHLQEAGLGDHRKLGCGVFMPD